MDPFRTEINIARSSTCISLSDRILTLGSCFSDAIGLRLKINKIPTMVNPFGVLYNPNSIHKAVQYIVSNLPPEEATFVQRNELFFNYDFHSQFSSDNLDGLKEQIKEAIAASHLFLKETTWLIVTYGTAWIYERADTEEVVGNCHKMPSSIFVKSCLTQKKILESFELMYRALKSFNPELKIILTVSPVRHLKDTIELNNVSKSVLRVACHTLTEQYQDVQYFPSFEIMMDDLRDYRFYKADMIHPSAVAEDYIWQKFSERYFDDDLKLFLSKWKEIRMALSHRPFHAASSAHQKFLKETIKKLQELKEMVSVDEEMAMLAKQLKK